MRTTVFLVDDASHTRERLLPLLESRPAALQTDTDEIVLVGCAPRMTHRVSKWVSHGAREHWRTKWAHRLFDELEPWLAARGLRVRCVLARGPLDELLGALRPDQVVDLRRPKASAPIEPPREPARPAWRTTLLLFGLGALVALSEA